MRALASHLTGALAVSILAPVALVVTACSTQAAQLSVTISSTFGASYTPGTTDADFVVTVQNLGPGNASGVVIHAVMPASFQYSVTNSITTNGAARTTPEDAQVGVTNPEWGVWSLSSPTSPNGQADYASVSINFGVNITAQPNTYSLAAQVVDDSLTDTVQSRPIQLAINEAPRLGVTASVGPSSVHPNGQVTYRVTVTNKGTGIAPTVDVLVTLPPSLQYQSTIMPFGGNSSVESLISPVKGAYLVFYGGFEIPPQTSLGPGTLTIEFIAQCIPVPGKGVFPIQVAVTDASRDQVGLANAAPLNVFSS
ncbi:MAG: COG1361 family protein [Candidatus Dormibacteria bacterium]